MTEPGPVAALAAQLEELRGQLARAQGDVGHVRARLEAGAGQTMMLRLEVKQLRERLGEALETHKLEPAPAPWWCTGETEGKAMLAELREWVDGFARRHYPGYLARLPACWANHPEAVWELSTLRAEWQRVYAEPGNAELQGALNWHDKWLPGVLGRLAASVKCDEAGCRRPGQ
jgi:regulator of replication initiation timing